MKRIFLSRQIGLLTWVFVMLSGIAWGAPDPKQIDELLKNPTLVYEKPYTVATTEAIWVKVLENPLIIGSLWSAYNFQPAYQITSTPSGIHVVDPSGIIGDIGLIDSAGTSRRFYGHGSVNHWMIPSFFSARGIIQFQYRMEQNRVHINLKLSIKGSNSVSNLVVRTFSGLLLNHIGKRIDSHMADIQKVADEISQSPEKTQKRLTGKPLEDFNRLFMTKAP